jgi:predicted SnoaL-like aldol condensation-catalyzing enzyme
MKTTNKKTSEEFSSGNFESTYPHLAEDIQWNILGSTTLKGKKAVIDHCTKMRGEMAGATMKNLNHISDGDIIVVQGHCDYKNPDNTNGRVEYCDVYRFKNDTVQEITSYCIEAKMN